MASTKDISVSYSEKLDSMTTYIARFLASNEKPDIERRIHKSISDFCYRNTVAFKSVFLQKVGLTQLNIFQEVRINPEIVGEFNQRLRKIDGEAVFLLKDTFDVMEDYQAKTKKGFGILINRNFLTRTEEDYFILIKLIYDTLSDSNDIDDFLEKYKENFRRLVESNKHFLDKSKYIFEYVSSHTVSEKVTFIDIGFQFTFSLFCYASILLHGKGKLEADFYSFSAYPWLQDFFQGKYFSEKSELVLGIELPAIEHYQEKIKDKSAGGMLGFAIGDALGFPVAGINKADMPKFLTKEILSFADNRQHPFFSHLEARQYTDNTTLLMMAAHHLIENKALDIQKYQQDLIGWLKDLKEGEVKERWMGPTARQAIEKLMAGESYLTSGSTTTASCSSTYRVVPLGLFYRPFYRNESLPLKDTAAMMGMITHNSDISITGTVVVALILSDLINFVLPEHAILAATGKIEVTGENKKLVDKIQEAIEFSKTESVEFAREYFGTGSPIYQTLPLAIFLFLKYQDDFGKAVLAAANSYRNDTVKEKERLAGLSWEEQLQQAQGGNTDGIAALVGAFTGTHLGLDKIPEKFLAVENRDAIINLGFDLLS